MTEPTDDGPLEVRYSWPLKIGLGLAPAVLGGLGVLVLWVALDLRSSSLFFAIFMAAIGLWFLYVAYLAVRALPFLNVLIVVRDWGLEITHRDSVLRLPWAEIGAVRRDSVHQVLTLRGGSGEIVFMVDYKIKGFHGLDFALREFAHR